MYMCSPNGRSKEYTQCACGTVCVIDTKYSLNERCKETRRECIVCRLCKECIDGVIGASNVINARNGNSRRTI